MLLIEIDKKMQAYGQLPDYSTLGTIEHVIPQKLDEAWTVYLGEEAEDEHLPTVIDTIGNLCLLSGPANSAVGKTRFSQRRRPIPRSQHFRQIGTQYKMGYGRSSRSLKSCEGSSRNLGVVKRVTMKRWQASRK